MDHQNATAIQAVDRYLLNELSPDEREEFEAHFFDCQECADEVKTGTALMVNGRAVAREQAGPFASPKIAEMASRRPRWTMPIAAAASVLLAITAYQNIFVIPRLSRQTAIWQSARAVTPSLLRAEQRGSLPVVKLQPLLALALEIPTDRQSGTYGIEIRKDPGAVVFTLPEAASHDGQIEILLPAAGLSPGDYEILVRELASAKLNRFRFHAEK